MATWPTLGAALTDLRAFLSDGPQDKPVKGKAIIGRIDGVNTGFYTWDDRLVKGSLTVSVNDADAAVSILDPDLVLGYFTFTTAPPIGAVIRAHYFYQYFFDSELEVALTQAASQTDAAGNVTLIAPGLQLSILHFAGFLAYEKMAMKWTERLSSRFLLLEAPIEQDLLSKSNMFRDIARDLRESARVIRLDYYQSQGRRATPAFGTYFPNIPNIVPRG